MARPSASPDLIAFPRRWAIENQWHWPRDTQHGEDDHRYSQSNGVQVLALLRTLALNLLRWKGFRSIRTGLTAEVHDISRVGVPGSGVIPPAPPPRRSRGGPRTSGGWLSGWRCKGWAGPFPWFEYHLNQTNHAQDPCCRT